MISTLGKFLILYTIATSCIIVAQDKFSFPTQEQFIEELNRRVLEKPRQTQSQLFFRTHGDGKYQMEEIQAENIYLYLDTSASMRDSETLQLHESVIEKVRTLLSALTGIKQLRIFNANGDKIAVYSHDISQHYDTPSFPGLILFSHNEPPVIYKYDGPTQALNDIPDNVRKQILLYLMEGRFRVFEDFFTNGIATAIESLRKDTSFANTLLLMMGDEAEKFPKEIFTASKNLYNASFQTDFRLYFIQGLKPRNAAYYRDSEGLALFRGPFAITKANKRFEICAAYLSTLFNGEFISIIEAPENEMIDIAILLKLEELYPNSLWTIDRSAAQADQYSQMLTNSTIKTPSQLGSKKEVTHLTIELCPKNSHLITVTDNSKQGIQAFQANLQKKQNTWEVTEFKEITPMKFNKLSKAHLNNKKAMP